MYRETVIKDELLQFVKVNLLQNGQTSNGTEVKVESKVRKCSKALMVP